MPFLGSQPAEQYKSLAKQTITGDGSTSYTLNRSVTNEFDIEVFINNTRQEPTTSYTATGNTITFTAAVTASDSCYIIFQGQAVGTVNPPTNSVGGAQIQNTSVTTAHLHTDVLGPITVDAANGVVGIKNTAPNNYLDGELTVGDSTKDQYVNVVTGTANAAGLCFQDTTGTSIVGGLRYTHLDNKLAFWANGSERAHVDSSGYFHVNNGGGACMIQKNGNQTLSAHSPTPITGFSHIQGDSAMFDSTNHRIVALAAGTYIVGACVQSNQLNGLHLGLLKNNASVGSDYWIDMGDASGVAYTKMFQMSANDFLSMTCYMTVGGNINQYRTQMFMAKVA